MKRKWFFVFFFLFALFYQKSAFNQNLVSTQRNPITNKPIMMMEMRYDYVSLSATLFGSGSFNISFLGPYFYKQTFDCFSPKISFIHKNYDKKNDFWGGIRGIYFYPTVYPGVNIGIKRGPMILEVTYIFEPFKLNKGFFSGEITILF